MNQIKKASVIIIVLALSSFFGFAQDIRINELVSANTTHTDADGDTPDWFEIYNYGSTTVSLYNWAVSDDENEPAKWVFPEISLEANEYLLLYASGKDRKYLTFPRTVVNQGELVKYMIPDSEPSPNWKTINYDDDSWEEGPTGIGYGDDDDATVIPEGTNSVYIRASFNMSYLNELLYFIFDIDYDDGFVAYINGTEVARANVDEEFPEYNDRASGEREAIMFNGGKPERYYLVTEEEYILEGENMLSIQLFNHDPSSSDLTIIPFLTGVFLSPTNVGDSPPEILDLPNRKFHTNYKISADGEALLLSNDQHEIVDQVPAMEIPVNLSVGRMGSEADLYYFTNTTPAEENIGPAYSGVLNSEVIFSHSGGFLNDPINLSMQGNTESQVIRYTSDATIPTEESTLYSTPIVIDSNTVIRASIFEPSYISSLAQNRTYIFDQNTELDAVFLTTDPYNLFDDEYGIYVFGPEGTYEPYLPYYGANFWEDWERPIHVAFYEKETGDLGTEFNAGVKIYGNWSRAQYDQRSLALYARSSYGDSKFEYPFFEHVAYDQFENLVLRNSGQDFLASSIKDISLTSLMDGSGLEYQDYRPVSTYINGEYWGMYHLREKVNEHMLASKSDVNPDEITLLTANAEAIEGTNEEYSNLLSYVSNTDLSIDENFEYVADQVDIDNYVQYLTTEIFIGNFDWPGSNIKYWKLPNGKWRWILYDTDQGFGLTTDTDNYDINSLNKALEEFGEGWPNPPWSTLLFRQLITNLGFRNTFINRYADELNTRFLADDVKTHFDQVSQMIQSEVEPHYMRWDGEPNDQSYYVEEMKIWAENRPAFAKEQLMTQFQLPNIHRITIMNEDVEEGFVKVNNHLKIMNAEWTGDYFETVPIELKAIPQFGYAFSHWSGASNSSEATINLDLHGEASISPHFTIADDYRALVINEINYKSSPDFNAGDWIEIHNPNESSVDISNWIIKDNNDQNAFYFPEGTSINPNGYLVITKNQMNFKEVFPQVSNLIGDLSFGFSGDQDAVRLFSDEEILHDEVIYQSIDPWPICAAGNGPSLELISPELDNAIAENWKCINPHGSPGSANTEAFAIPEDIINIFQVYPNPVDDILYITGNSQSVFIKIYTISGQELMSAKAQSPLQVSHLNPGVYILEISDGNKYSRRKLFKK